MTNISGPRVLSVCSKSLASKSPSPPPPPPPHTFSSEDASLPSSDEDSVHSDVDVSQLPTSDVVELGDFSYEELANFDYATAEKKLYCEDGVPDVLYRRIEIKCLAHEPDLLNSYQTFVEMTTQGLRIPVEVEEPCRVVERKTVLRSAFVHKAIRTQYEWYTHYRLFKFVHLTGSTADTLLEYLQRNMPEGMAMEVAKTRVERLPAGVEAAKGETPSKEEVFGGRQRYDVDTVKPYPKPDPAKMPDYWNPRSKDERHEPIPI